MKETDNNTKKIALTGLFIGAAFVLNYLETLLPVFIPIPGIKLGLANIVVMFAIYTLGPVYAVGIGVVRVVLSGLTYGSLFTILYSFAGCALSLIAMLLMKRKGVSVLLVSVLGAVAHNLGQMIVAMLLLGKGVLYYSPVLLAAALVTGIINGAVLKQISTKKN